MRIVITEAFDYDLGGGMTLHGTPSDDPVTIKREPGEFAVAAGKEYEVDAKGKKVSKTLPKKSAKADGNDDAGQMGSAVSGQAGGPDIAADASSDGPVDDLAQSGEGADLV